MGASLSHESVPHRQYAADDAQARRCVQCRGTVWELLCKTMEGKKTVWKIRGEDMKHPIDIKTQTKQRCSGSKQPRLRQVSNRILNPHSPCACVPAVSAVQNTAGSPQYILLFPTWTRKKKGRERRKRESEPTFRKRPEHTSTLLLCATF